MKYLVMETHTSYAVVLDEKGNFFIAANLGYEVGQKVEQPEILHDTLSPERKKSSFSKRIMSVVAAAAACFVLVFGINSYMLNAAVYGSVYMTINPEVKIDLNKKERVVDVIGLNKDGELLAAAQDYKGLTASEACAMLTDYAMQQGLLSDGGAVLFEVDAEDKGFFNTVGTSIRINVGKIIENKVDADLYVADYKDGFSIPPRESQTPDVSTGQSVTIELPPTQQATATPAPATPAPAKTPAPTQAPAVTEAAPATPAPAPADDDSNYNDDQDSGYETRKQATMMMDKVFIFCNRYYKLQC